MYMLTHSRDVARETAERALRAPIGWMSPFWFVYGAALSVGTTWWLMNQFGRPTNLEAAHDAHIGIEAPAARLSANQETGTDAPRSEAVDATGSEHGTASVLARAAETQAAAEVESGADVRGRGRRPHTHRWDRPAPLGGLGRAWRDAFRADVGVDGRGDRRGRPGAETEGWRQSSRLGRASPPVRRPGRPPPGSLTKWSPRASALPTGCPWRGGPRFDKLAFPLLEGSRMGARLNPSLLGVVALALSPLAARAAGSPPGDWRSDAPGVVHRIAREVPAPSKPTAAPSAVVARPGALPKVPPGFTVSKFAELDAPRQIRAAPNGDLFVAETDAGRVTILRAADGAAKADTVSPFASGLDRPFGVAFWPPGPAPRFVYVATNNSVVRFPYRPGDLKASGPAQTVVAKLAETTGGHTTRDLVFSPDGRTMYVSVGSGSNTAESMPTKTAGEIRAWEAAHARGAAWGARGGPRRRARLHPARRRADNLRRRPAQLRLHGHPAGYDAALVRRQRARRSWGRPAAGLRHLGQGRRLLWLALVVSRRP